MLQGLLLCFLRMDNPKVSSESYKNTNVAGAGEKPWKPGDRRGGGLHLPRRRRPHPCHPQLEANQHWWATFWWDRSAPNMALSIIIFLANFIFLQEFQSFWNFFRAVFKFQRFWRRWMTKAAEIFPRTPFQMFWWFGDKLPVLCKFVPFLGFHVKAESTRK